MSRDDYGSFIRFSWSTTSSARDPFQTIDTDGAGVLMQKGFRKAGPRDRSEGGHLRRARRRPRHGQVLPQVA